MVNVLPNAENAVIPIEKFINYSLDVDKDYNKATAFRLALGYTAHNATGLIENIRKSIYCYTAVYKGNNGYGETYECVVELIGENNCRANVLTSWIIINGTDYPRLTNAYITKKKARKFT